MTLKRKRLIIVFVFLSFTAILLMIGLGPMLSVRHEAESDGPIIQEIPQAEEVRNPDNKTEGYRDSRSINDYFDSLEEQRDAGRAGEGTESGGYRELRQISVEDLFEEAEEPERPSGGAPPPKRAPKAAKASQTKPEPYDESVPAKDSSSSPEEAPAPKPLVKRSGAVSSLDEDVAADLGNGFSTLDGRNAWLSDEESKPYRCMFTRSEKVRSGQRITLRLLEDLIIGNTHIPRNTHLQGVCTISDRMEISLTSLDMGGRILSFSFEAYDTDGMKGIYCSDLSQDAQTVTERGISTASSALNSRLGRTARDVASVGASIIRNKTGEVTVSIPSGYTFYIMEKRQ